MVSLIDYTMPKYFNREGGIVDSPRSFQLPDITETIYGVSDIIDIILLGRNHQAFSTSPTLFSQYTNSNQQAARTSKDYVPDCSGDSQVPISTSFYSRSTAEQINKFAIANGVGAYHNNSSLTKLGDYGTTLFDYVLAQLWNPNDKDKKGNKVDSTWKCTEFFTVFYDTDCLNYVLYEGYQMFSPNDYTHPFNWFRYDAQSSNHDNYCLVLYLTKKNYLLERACFQSFTPSQIQYLSSNTGDALTQQLTNDFCQSPFSYPTWSELRSPATLYAGQSIYSPNSKFKLTYQVDGNLVIYNLVDRTPIWGSDTRFVENVFGRFDLQSDGNFVLYRKDNKPVWHTQTYGSGDVVLRMGDNGVAAIFKVNDLYNPVYQFRKNDSQKYESTMNLFSPFCSSLIVPAVNNKKVAKAQVEYCMRDKNILNDDRCKPFKSSTIPYDDDGKLKAQLDVYVLDNICNSNLDKNDAKAVSFCSCAYPIDNSRKLLEEASLQPKCWSTDCTNNGYQVKNYDSVSCPSSICVQNIDLKNLANASGIKVSCDVKTTNVTQTSAPTPAVTTPTSTTASATSPTSTTASAASSATPTSTTASAASSATPTQTSANTSASSATPTSATTTSKPSSGTSASTTSNPNNVSTSPSTQSKRMFSDTQIYMIVGIVGFILLMSLGMLLIKKRTSSYSMSDYDQLHFNGQPFMQQPPMYPFYGDKH